MNSEQLLSQLADIELPTSEPSTASTIWLLTGAFIILAFVAYVFWRKHQAPQYNGDSAIAVEKLSQLHHQWRDGSISNRETAYRLCAILRLGLNLKQLTLTPPEHLKNHQTQWQTCIKQLQNMRYEHGNTHSTCSTCSTCSISEDMFTLSRSWLTQRGLPPS